jgi:hypothetical protein
MLWLLVTWIVLLTITESERTTHSTSTTTTTLSSSQSIEPTIPDTDLSSITLNIDNNNSNDNNDNDSTLEEDAELETQLSSIIDESSKTSKSKKNIYKSKYLLYIMSRNYKKKEYKEYVKNNKKAKIEDKFELYIESDEYIKSLNENSNDGAIYNHTKFSDWSMEEKEAILLPIEQIEEHQRRRRRMLANCYSFGGWGKGVSSSVNYRSYAQPIQNQGSCGSCWDFSSIGQYEFNYLKYKGISQKQSEQYVLDCVSDSIGNCANGGFPDLTNRWLAESGSCPSSSYYKYDGHEYLCSSCWSSKTPKSYVACITESSTGYARNSNTFWSIIANAAQYVSLSIGMLVSNNFYYISSSSPYLYSCDTRNILGGHAMAIYGVGTSGNSMLVKKFMGYRLG